MNGFTVSKHGRSRFWALRDGAGELVCLCVYKRGALEVARRLGERETPEAAVLRETPPEAVGAGDHGFSEIPLDSLSSTPERPHVRYKWTTTNAEGKTT